MIILTDDQPIPCAAQRLRYQLIYTVGVFLTTCQSLVMGFVIDKYGPMKTNVGNCLLFGVGCFLFILADFYGMWLDPFKVRVFSLMILIDSQERI